MDEEIKNLLLNIQSDIKQINNKLDEVEKTASNGNFAYTDEGNNSEQNKNIE